MRPTRWTIAPARPDLARPIAEATGLPLLLAQVLVNRGLTTPEAAEIFLDPDLETLPSPLEDFPDLPLALDLIAAAIDQGQTIAICGDYDADGMTSTALLIRALRALSANVVQAIPSRMTDGYGINQRIVEEFHEEGVALILTVDNGIAAREPVARARELGMTVIITDHHDVPAEVPPAHAILNPKLIREDSPYRGLAGVGVAYLLAVSLAKHLGQASLWRSLLELFTLGTIADLAPLRGVNRRWVKRGLSLLPFSRLAGVRALQQVAGLAVLPVPPVPLESGPGSESGSTAQAELSTTTPPDGLGTTGLPATPLAAPPAPIAPSSPTAKGLKPEAIGFRLGPRINAIGRLDDPQIVIDLLTTDDEGIALERAMQCEQVNHKRQQLCSEIEQAAIAWYETSDLDLSQTRVLVVVQPDWHHGVIGIVASRLVERYGAPVFIGTYESHDPSHIRGSARGIPEFNVFEALDACGDLLTKYGGHKAAGGFSLPADRLADFQARLSEFARGCLAPEHLKPLVRVDVQANFNELDLELYEQIDALHPCGIENDEPTFWTAGVQVTGQRRVGKESTHLKFTVAQATPVGMMELGAIAWHWGDAFPLPDRVDVAYRLKENVWRDQVSLELEVLSLRPATAIAPGPASPGPASPTRPIAQENRSPWPSPRPQPARSKASFRFQDRDYTCSWGDRDGQTELRIRNPEGNILALVDGETTGLLGASRATAQVINLDRPFFQNLLAAAKRALGERL